MVNSVDGDMQGQNSDQELTELETLGLTDPLLPPLPPLGYGWLDFALWVLSRQSESEEALDLKRFRDIFNFLDVDVSPSAKHLILTSLRTERQHPKSLESNPKKRFPDSTTAPLHAWLPSSSTLPSNDEPLQKNSETSESGFDSSESELRLAELEQTPLNRYGSPEQEVLIDQAQSEDVSLAIVQPRDTSNPQSQPLPKEGTLLPETQQNSDEFNTTKEKIEHPLSSTPSNPNAKNDLGQTGQDLSQPSTLSNNTSLLPLPLEEDFVDSAIAPSPLVSSNHETATETESAQNLTSHEQTFDINEDVSPTAVVEQSNPQPPEENHESGLDASSEETIKPEAIAKRAESSLEQTVEALESESLNPSALHETVENQAEQIIGLDENIQVRSSAKTTPNEISSDFSPAPQPSNTPETTDLQKNSGATILQVHDLAQPSDSAPSQIPSAEAAAPSVLDISQTYTSLSSENTFLQVVQVHEDEDEKATSPRPSNEDETENSIHQSRIEQPTTPENNSATSLLPLPLEEDFIDSAIAPSPLVSSNHKTATETESAQNLTSHEQTFDINEDVSPTAVVEQSNPQPPEENHESGLDASSEETIKPEAIAKRAESSLEQTVEALESESLNPSALHETVENQAEQIIGLDENIQVRSSAKTTPNEISSDFSPAPQPSNTPETTDLQKNSGATILQVHDLAQPSDSAPSQIPSAEAAAPSVLDISQTYTSLSSENTFLQVVQVHEDEDEKATSPRPSNEDETENSIHQSRIEQPTTPENNSATAINERLHSSEATHDDELYERTVLQAAPQIHPNTFETSVTESVSIPESSLSGITGDRPASLQEVSSLDGSTKPEPLFSSSLDTAQSDTNGDEEPNAHASIVTPHSSQEKSFSNENQFTTPISETAEQNNAEPFSIATSDPRAERPGDSPIPLREESRVDGSRKTEPLQAQSLESEVIESIDDKSVAPPHRKQGELFSKVEHASDTTSETSEQNNVEVYNITESNLRAESSGENTTPLQEEYRFDEARETEPLQTQSLENAVIESIDDKSVAPSHRGQGELFFSMERASDITSETENQNITETETQTSLENESTPINSSVELNLEQITNISMPMEERSDIFISTPRREPQQKNLPTQNSLTETHEKNQLIEQNVFAQSQDTQNENISEEQSNWLNRSVEWVKSRLGSKSQNKKTLKSTDNQSLSSEDSDEITLVNNQTKETLESPNDIEFSEDENIEAFVENDLTFKATHPRPPSIDQPVSISNTTSTKSFNIGNQPVIDSSQVNFGNIESLAAESVSPETKLQETNTIDPEESKQDDSSASSEYTYIAKATDDELIVGLARQPKNGFEKSPVEKKSSNSHADTSNSSSSQEVSYTALNPDRTKEIDTPQPTKTYNTQNHSSEIDTDVKNPQEEIQNIFVVEDNISPYSIQTPLKEQETSLNTNYSDAPTTETIENQAQSPPSWGERRSLTSDLETPEAINKPPSTQDGIDAIAKAQQQPESERVLELHPKTLTNQPPTSDGEPVTDQSIHTRSESLSDNVLLNSDASGKNLYETTQPKDNESFQIPSSEATALSVSEISQTNSPIPVENTSLQVVQVQDANEEANSPQPSSRIGNFIHSDSSSEQPTAPEKKGVDELNERLHSNESDSAHKLPEKRFPQETTQPYPNHIESSSNTESSNITDLNLSISENHPVPFQQEPRLDSATRPKTRQTSSDLDTTQSNIDWVNEPNINASIAKPNNSQEKFFSMEDGSIQSLTETVEQGIEQSSAEEIKSNLVFDSVETEVQFSSSDRLWETKTSSNQPLFINSDLNHLKSINAHTEALSKEKIVETSEPSGSSDFISEDEEFKESSVEIESGKAELEKTEPQISSSIESSKHRAQENEPEKPAQSEIRFVTSVKGIILEETKNNQSNESAENIDARKIQKGQTFTISHQEDEQNKNSVHHLEHNSQSNTIPIRAEERSIKETVQTYNESDKVKENIIEVNENESVKKTKTLSNTISSLNTDLEHSQIFDINTPTQSKPYLQDETITVQNLESISQKIEQQINKESIYQPIREEEKHQNVDLTSQPSSEAIDSNLLFKSSEEDEENTSKKIIQSKIEAESLKNTSQILPGQEKSKKESASLLDVPLEALSKKDVFDSTTDNVQTFISTPELSEREGKTKQTLRQQTSIKSNSINSEEARSSSNKPSYIKTNNLYKTNNNAEEITSEETINITPENTLLLQQELKNGENPVQSIRDTNIIDNEKDITLTKKRDKDSKETLFEEDIENKNIKDLSEPITAKERSKQTKNHDERVNNQEKIDFIKSEKYHLSSFEAGKVKLKHKSIDHWSSIEELIGSNTLTPTLQPTGIEWEKHSTSKEHWAKLTNSTKAQRKEDHEPQNLKPSNIQNDSIPEAWESLSDLIQILNINPSNLQEIYSIETEIFEDKSREEDSLFKNTDTLNSSEIKVQKDSFSKPSQVISQQRFNEIIQHQLLIKKERKGTFFANRSKIQEYFPDKDDSPHSKIDNSSSSKIIEKISMDMQEDEALLEEVDNDWEFSKQIEYSILLERERQGIYFWEKRSF
jgi:hypothetical protein